MANSYQFNTIILNSRCNADYAQSGLSDSACAFCWVARSGDGNLFATPVVRLTNWESARFQEAGSGPGFWGFALADDVGSAFPSGYALNNGRYQSDYHDGSFHGGNSQHDRSWWAG